MLSRRLAVSLALLFSLAGAARAAEPAGRRLVLFGGGSLPPAAVDRFVEWSGAKKARILILPWASLEQRETGEGVRAKFLARGAASAELAVSTASAGWAAALRRQLAGATGVFITGGDQARFMSVVDSGTLLGDIEKAYAAGTVFAGTSAGTAVMSRIMLTGEGNFEVIDASTVAVRGGLGLLAGAIVDQHFIIRQRENRLFGLVLAHPDQLGVGVDESTAFAVQDDRYGETFGTTGAVMVVEALGGGSLRVDLVRPGRRYDLKERKAL